MSTPWRSGIMFSEYQQTVQGKQVAYKKYVRNTVGLSGATKFKVTFTKA